MSKGGFDSRLLSLLVVVAAAEARHQNKPVDNDLGVSDFYYLHKSTVVNHFQLVFNSNCQRQRDSAAAAFLFRWLVGFCTE